MSIKPYVETLNSALKAAMEADGSVMLLGTNVRARGDLYKKFGGERVIDIPLSNDCGVGLALGLAQTGARPVVEIDGEYLLRAADTVANQVALNDFIYNGQYGSCLVMLAYTGYVKNASPQISQSYEAMFCHIPALTVVMPSDPKDLSDTLQAAIAASAPVLYLIDKHFLGLTTDEAPQNKAGADAEQTEEINNGTETPEAQTLALGQARISAEGEDVSIITYGPMVEPCLAAAEKARGNGISCEVIDLVTLHPFDRGTIVNSVIKTGKAVIAHKAHKTGGLGAEIAAAITESEAFNYLEQPIIRVCAEDMPVGYAEAYYECVLPTADDVYAAVLNLTE